jgi:hypothetical protein
MSRDQPSHRLAVDPTQEPRQVPKDEPLMIRFAAGLSHLAKAQKFVAGAAPQAWGWRELRKMQVLRLRGAMEMRRSAQDDGTG